MKINIAMVCRGTIDTEIERSRIQREFEGEEENLFKLNEFMDSIESLDFSKSKELLDSEWWNGEDKNLRCPRKEFIGKVFRTGDAPDGFDSYFSYKSLVSAGLNKEGKYFIEKPNA